MIHKAGTIKTVVIDGESYVPLSLYVAADGVVADSEVSVRRDRPATGDSLLKTLPSPLLTSGPPRASLMDSLSPRNSPTPASVSKDGIVFFAPRIGDCPERAGLSFIVPALVSEDDYIGKLVELLSLCLIQSIRLAQTEALIRPLLDLLMSMKSMTLPPDALSLVQELIDIASPRFNSFSTQQRPISFSQRPLSPRNALGGPVYSALGNIIY
jgi:hypothetical protein